MKTDYSIVPSGQPFNESPRGWTGIRAVRIDNLTNQWLSLPDGTFVQPYTYGVIIETNGIGSYQIGVTAPSNTLQTSVIAGESYAVTMYDTALGASPGVAIPTPNSFVEFTQLLTIGAGLGNPRAIFANLGIKNVRQMMISPLPTNTGKLYISHLVGMVSPWIWPTATSPAIVISPNNRELWIATDVAGEGAMLAIQF